MMDTVMGIGPCECQYYTFVSGTLARSLKSGRIQNKEPIYIGYRNNRRRGPSKGSGERTIFSKRQKLGIIGGFIPITISMGIH
jgi:hypothetical protein